MHNISWPAEHSLDSKTLNSDCISFSRPRFFVLARSAKSFNCSNALRSQFVEVLDKIQRTVHLVELACTRIDEEDVRAVICDLSTDRDRSVHS